MIDPEIETNPLLAALYPRISHADLPEKFSRNPLDRVNLKALNFAQREDLLIQRQNFLTPSKSALTIVRRTHRLIRDSLAIRDPRLPNIKAYLHKIAIAAEQNLSLEVQFPNFSAGMSVEGITGLMKTFSIIRALELLGPQVIHHKANASSGWIAWEQITYLVVSAGTTGGITGFLQSVLHGIDGLLETNFQKQHGRLLVDALIKQVCALLGLRFTGLLVIEEVQLKSLGKDSALFSLFVLTLMNFGVPVCLVGNPLAMEKIDKFSQDTRRLTIGGSISLLPYLGSGEKEFQGFAKEIFAFSVMPMRRELDAADFDLIYRYTGGIPDFISRLNAEAQLIALEREADQIQTSDLDAAYNGETLVKNHALIRALVMKQAELLSGLEDIPIAGLRTVWSEFAAHADTSADLHVTKPRTKGSKGAETPAAAENGRRLAKQKAHRKEKTELDTRLKAELPSSDIRNGGASAVYVAEFDKLAARAAQELNSTKA